MNYTQSEVDFLLRENTLEILLGLKEISRKTRRKLHQKGKLLIYGSNVHIIPKHIFNLIEKGEKILLLKSSEVEK